MMNTVRRRAVFVLAALAACTPDPHNHVLLYNDGALPPLIVTIPPAQHKYMAGFATAPGSSDQWTVQLPDRLCERDVEIRFQRDAGTAQGISEAHFFARDPQDVFNEVSKYHGYDVVSTASFLVAGERRTRTGFGLPNAVVVPFPPTPPFDITKPVITFIPDNHWFFPNGPDLDYIRPDVTCTDQSVQDGNVVSVQAYLGTIQGLRTYQRGLCANATALGGDDGLLHQINSSFWTSFQQQAGHTSSRVAEFALSYLRRGATTSDVQGGFFQILDLIVSFGPDPNWQDWFDSNYNYDFTLSRGILSVVPHENSLSVTGTGADPGAFRTALSQTLPATFQQQALLKQAQFIPLVSLQACDRMDPTVKQCAPAGESIASIFTPQPGAFPPPDVTQLKCSLGSATACNAVGRDPAAALEAAWACVDRPPDPNTPNIPDYSHCEYVLRAQRLNVFEDAVELVVFDTGPDLTNPVFAFQAFLRGAGRQDDANRICDPRPLQLPYQQPPNYDPVIYSRPFARDIQSDNSAVLTAKKLKDTIKPPSMKPGPAPSGQSATPTPSAPKRLPTPPRPTPATPKDNATSRQPPK